MSFEELPVVQKFHSLDSAIEAFAMKASLNAFMQEDEGAPRAGYHQLLGMMDADDIVGSLKKISVCALEFDGSYTQNNFTCDISVQVYNAKAQGRVDFPVYAALIVEMVDYPRCAGFFDEEATRAIKSAAFEVYRDAATPEAKQIVAEIDALLKAD